MHYKISMSAWYILDNIYPEGIKLPSNLKQDVIK